ncbi:MAG: TonB-dependent receptor [Hyphomicrobiales bacterium]|nr:TonB-dependent receptor [Hyphomicrobiales bacterium]
MGKTTWKCRRAAFDVTESLTPFVSYGCGFEGVAAFTGETSAKPEESEQIEAGVRFSFDAIGLSGSAAVYELTRQNVPVADPNRPGIQIQTGEQRARGAEFDLIWKATSDLTILGNYAYTDAEVTVDTTIPEGDRLARVPLHSGRIAALYEFSSGCLDGLGLGLGLTAASEREITLPNDLETDAFFSIDAQASYEIGLAVLRLSIENLTDEEYFEPYQFLGQSVVRPARPRTVFLSLSATY